MVFYPDTNGQHSNKQKKTTTTTMNNSSRKRSTISSSSSYHIYRVRRLGWTCVVLSFFWSTPLSLLLLIHHQVHDVGFFVGHDINSGNNPGNSPNSMNVVKHNRETLSSIWMISSSTSGLFAEAASVVDDQDNDDDVDKNDDDATDTTKTSSSSRTKNKEDHSIGRPSDIKTKAMVDPSTSSENNKAPKLEYMYVTGAAFPPVPSNFRQILRKAWRKALGGGIPGAIAGIIQVVLLMWLRTVINYQSRYGTSFLRALSILYNEGGIPRFYRGLGFALFQAPISRFVATASNDGVLSLLSNLPATRHWGPGFKTFFASFVVGIARIAMMPIDTAKTVLQVDSFEGFNSLIKRVKSGDVGALYQGAWATALSSSLGHYPWYETFDFT